MSPGVIRITKKGSNTHNHVFMKLTSSKSKTNLPSKLDKSKASRSNKHIYNGNFSHDSNFLSELCTVWCHGRAHSVEKEQSTLALDR